MKNNRLLYIFPSIFLFLLCATFPLLKILVEVKKINSLSLNILSMVYFVILIITIISIFVEVIYLIYDMYVNKKMKISKKIIWTILLIQLNVLIIPYYYMKYIDKEKKIVFYSLVYLIPIIFLTYVTFYGIDVYKYDMNKINLERKKIEEERITYNTKDNKVSFIFKHGYVKKEVGEYDLYVLNQNKNIIFTAFTYETDKYVQKTADSFINKGIDDIKNNKVQFDLYKDKEYKDLSDKKITSIEYVGKSATSSECIYKISVIEFKNTPNYLVYVTQVVTKKNYKLYKDEMNDILINAKKL